MAFLLNTVVSALVIAFASWLSGRTPRLAGFIVALPLATMLVLPLSYWQHGNPATSIALARSIFVAVPLTLTFFVPFLLSDRIGLSFWQAYGLACITLSLAFFVHRLLAQLLGA